MEKKQIIKGLKWIKTYWWEIDFLRTFILNFRKLPINQAIKFPIILGHGVKLKNISGQFIINTNHISPAMITFAIYNTVTDYNSYIGFIENCGKIIFKGNVKIHTGAKIVVRNNGCLMFEGENTLGHSTTVCCTKSIRFGYFATFSWNCQIFDTNFHFFQNLATGTIKPRNKAVNIGKYVFCGNGSNIGKGVNIPDGCVISNFSVVNKDFSNEGTNLLLAGNPAIIIKRGYKYIVGDSFRRNIPEEELAKTLD